MELEFEGIIKDGTSHHVFDREFYFNTDIIRKHK